MGGELVLAGAERDFFERKHALAGEDELVGGGELTLAGAVVPRVVAEAGFREEAVEVSGEHELTCGELALACAEGDVSERLRLSQVLRGEEVGTGSLSRASGPKISTL